MSKRALYPGMVIVFVVLLAVALAGIACGPSQERNRSHWQRGPGRGGDQLQRA